MQEFHDKFGCSQTTEVFDRRVVLFLAQHRFCSGSEEDEVKKVLLETLLQESQVSSLSEALVVCAFLVSVAHFSMCERCAVSKISDL